MAACYACGTEQETLSERDFCQQCETDFQAGQAHSEYVVARASRLEEARDAGDLETVAEISAEIAKESVTLQPAPQTIDVQPTAGVE